MRKLILTILLLFPFLLLGQTPIDDKDWELFLEDNFNFLDRTNWNVINNDDHGGEPQVYRDTPDNVFIENGNLVLKMIQEDYNCPPCDIDAHHYTSGEIQTTAQHNLKYGFMEARIHLPYGQAFWPAFWTYIGDGITPASFLNNANEIDIFEMLGHQPSTTMGTNLHLDYCPETCAPSDNCKDCDALYKTICTTDDRGFPNNIYCYQEDITIPSYAGVYHKYAVEWSPSKIIWYVDDKTVRNFPNPGIVDPVKIILNFALSKGQTPNPISLPAKMYIDYVRVYKLKGDCDKNIVACNYDFTQYDNKVKKKIIIGEGSNCASTISAGSNVSIRAVESVELKGDFSVPLGAAFYADAVGNCDATIDASCTSTFNACIYDFSNWNNNDIRGTMELGGNDCDITIPVTTNKIELKATQKITLLPGFKTATGAKVKMEIVNCE